MPHAMSSWVVPPPPNAPWHAMNSRCSTVGVQCVCVRVCVCVCVCVCPSLFLCVCVLCVQATPQTHTQPHLDDAAVRQAAAHELDDAHVVDVE